MITTTIRDLRRDPTLAPHGRNYERLLESYLPLVAGSAAALIPEDPQAAVRVTETVFQSFGLYWRKLARRTLIAGWLVRTTWLAARRERRVLRLGTPSPASDTRAILVLFKALNRLPSKLLDPVVAHLILGQPLSAASLALRAKESRLSKRIDKALSNIGKTIRKQRLRLEPRLFLANLPQPVTPDTREFLLSRLRERPTTKDQPIRAVLRAWRWIRFKRLLRRCFVTFATGLGLLLITALSIVWLGRQGYLTLVMLRFANRGLVKQFPELAQPARPWPDTPAAAVQLNQKPPETSAQLYSLTNIWLAKLSLTADQWRRLQPSHVPPIFNMQQPDGTLVLRNPKAHRSGLAGVIGLDYNFPEVAVRYRGNGTFVQSLFGPKQSFKVDVGKFDKHQTLGGIHTLNFVNAIPDNSYVHDALAERLFRDLGVPAPRTAYAYLSLDVPGKFTNQALGLYVLVENIDRDFAADRFGNKNVPIFKPVTPHLFRDLGPGWKPYAQTYDLKTHATPEQLDRIVQFSQLVSHADDAEFSKRLSEFLDLNEFAAFLAGHVLLSSYDGFLTNGQNFYMYLDPHSNKFGFISWDHDHAWGEFAYIATADRRERASIWNPAAYDNHFLNRVLKVEEFRAIYRHVLEEALQNLFTIQRLDRQIDELAAVIRPAVAAESDYRLKRFDLAVSTNWLAGPRDGAPEGPKAPVHQIKRFIANRVASVRDQLDGRSKGVVLVRERFKRPQ